MENNVHWMFRIRFNSIRNLTGEIIKYIIKWNGVLYDNDIVIPSKMHIYT